MSHSKHDPYHVLVILNFSLGNAAVTWSCIPLMTASAIPNWESRASVRIIEKNKNDLNNKYSFSSSFFYFTDKT